MKEKKPGGKKHGQKYKSFLVWQLLLQLTDNDHAVSSKNLNLGSFSFCGGRKGGRGIQ